MTGGNPEERDGASTMRVRDWMTPRPATIGHDALLRDARELMDRGGFRHLPVVDRDGRLIAILTDRDVREHHGHLGDTRVTAAAVETPFTIGPDDPIEAAAGIVLGRKIGGLPVVDGQGRLVGMITETDLLRGLLGRGSRDHDPRTYLDVQLLRPAQTLSDAVAALENGGCTVLGARHVADPTATRTFRIHIEADDPVQTADALRGHGFGVRAIHRV